MTISTVAIWPSPLDFSSFAIGKPAAAAFVQGTHDCASLDPITPAARRVAHPLRATDLPQSFAHRSEAISNDPARIPIDAYRGAVACHPNRGPRGANT